MAEAERNARWEKASKPLFSKLWTYDGIKKAQMDKTFKKARVMQRPMPIAHLKAPNEWPSDTTIDPGNWVCWLLQGWKQGKRTKIVARC